MAYLSRIWLNVKKRDTMRALSRSSMFHGAIEAADPDGTRKLWRVDTVNRARCLVVLSPEKIDLSAVAEQFGDGFYEQSQYDGLLDKVADGTKWRFRLVANPTRRVDGKIKAHVSTRWQEAWLADRSEKNGFSLLPGTSGIVGRDDVKFQKEGDGPVVNFRSCAYEGVLEVTDAGLFRKMLLGGIGREKAYGQGLMTIVPLVG